MKAMITALAIALSIGSAAAQAQTPNLNAGPQDQPPKRVRIVITQVIDLENSKLIRYNNNNGTLNIMDASTFGDAKLMKLLSAADEGSPIELVIRGNVITDVP
jgi:predicted LPLAT superfamily acyltransferase